MQRKLLGTISVDLDKIGQLVIIYSAFVKYLREKKGINEAVYDSFHRVVLYSILIEFGIHMKLVRLIKMCLNETYSTVWVGKHLSDMFPIKNALKQEALLFNFA
jgi:hypothetical protein